MGFNLPIQLVKPENKKKERKKERDRKYRNWSHNFRAKSRKIDSYDRIFPERKSEDHSSKVHFLKQKEELTKNVRNVLSTGNKVRITVVQFGNLS